MTIVTNFVDFQKLNDEADRYRANAQQATARDIEIAGARKKQQDIMTLEDISRNSTDEQGNPDYNKIADEATKRGLWQQGMGIRANQGSFEGDQVARKTKSIDLRGQISQIPDAPPEQKDALWQQTLKDMESVDPKQAALMRQTDPVYTPETEKKLQLFRKQAITPYENEMIDVRRLRAKNLAHVSAGAQTVQQRTAIIDNLYRNGDISSDERNSALQAIAGSAKVDKPSALEDQIRKAYAVEHPLGDLKNDSPTLDEYRIEYMKRINANAPFPAAPPAAPGMPSPTVGSNAPRVGTRARPWPTPGSNDDWNKIRSGDVFIKSDGTLATKP